MSFFFLGNCLQNVPLSFFGPSKNQTSINSQCNDTFHVFYSFKWFPSQHSSESSSSNAFLSFRARQNVDKSFNSHKNILRM